MKDRKRQRPRAPQNRRRTGELIEAGKATQFKPGTCPNPGGRPKVKVLSQAIRQHLEEPFPDDPLGRTYAELIAEKLVVMAANGDLAAIREVTDRSEGKATHRLEVKSELAQLSDEELRAQLAELGFVHKGEGNG